MKRIIFICLFFVSVGIFAQSIRDQVVDAACGMCQFKEKSVKDCAMFVKINGNLYPLEGINQKAFGDAHADDGYCKVIQKAKVSGAIKKGKFYATSFKFLEN